MNLLVSLSLLFASILGNPAAEHEMNGLSTSKAVTNTEILIVNGPWQRFQFRGAGTFAETNYIAPVATGIAYLLVTDLYCPGDQFSIFANGSSLGWTSVVPTQPCQVAKTTDPDIAYGSATWSSHYFALPVGTHNITINVTLSPFTGGAAAIRLVNALPTGI